MNSHLEEERRSVMHGTADEFNNVQTTLSLTIDYIGLVLLNKNSAVAGIAARVEKLSFYGMVHSIFRYL